MKIILNPYCLTMFLLCTKLLYGEQWYYGDLHGHTYISDGAGTPRQYFGYAKNTSGLSFAALTDHDYLIDQVDSCQWDSIRYAANDSNYGNFVALIGYEWSADENVMKPDPFYGHICVYYPNNNPILYSCKDPSGYYQTPNNLFNAVATQGGVCHAAHSDFGATIHRKSAQ